MGSSFSAFEHVRSIRSKIVLFESVNNELGFGIGKDASNIDFPRAFFGRAKGGRSHRVIVKIILGFTKVIIILTMYFEQFTVKFDKGLNYV